MRHDKPTNLYVHDEKKGRVIARSHRPHALAAGPSAKIKRPTASAEQIVF